MEKHWLRCPGGPVKTLSRKLYANKVNSNRIPTAIKVNLYFAIDPGLNLSILKFFYFEQYYNPVIIFFNVCYKIIFGKPFRAEFLGQASNAIMFIPGFMPKNYFRADGSVKQFPVQAVDYCGEYGLFGRVIAAITFGLTRFYGINCCTGNVIAGV